MALSILHWRCHCFFSGGRDSAVACYIFQYSIGDAPQVWVAERAPPGGRLSILHWRCAFGVEIVVGRLGNLSILHWRCDGTAALISARGKTATFQYSIGDAAVYEDFVLSIDFYDFQYSIGDAKDLIKKGVAWRRKHFQYSIGDAKRGG